MRQEQTEAPEQCEHPLPVAHTLNGRNLGVLTEEISPEPVNDVLALCLFSGSDSTGPPGYRHERAR
ncbi:hypothetical protein GCM10018966_103850 [Streptomyces yanii]